MLRFSVNALIILKIGTQIWNLSDSERQITLQHLSPHCIVSCVHGLVKAGPTYRLTNKKSEEGCVK